MIANRIHHFWILLLCCMSGCVLVSGWTEWENVVNTARCRVRCFSTQQEGEGAGGVRAKSKTTDALKTCLENQACVECLKPCTQSYVNLPMCQRICDESVEPSCLESCEFLQRIYTSHPGTCPAPRDVILSAQGCGRECERDNMCGLDKKCCETQCGATCYPPNEPHIGMPPIPQTPQIREKAKSGSIELRWDMTSRVTSRDDHVVLYIIEESYSVGSEAEGVAHWQQIAQTTSKSRTLREIKPGHTYRFRVSAVNEQGTRGVSEVTEPYRLSREPNVPDPPRNLTEGDTIIKEGRIGVIVKWLPPKRSDLPVARYRVLWSKKSNEIDPQVITNGEQRENIDGEALQYEIPDLQPDTTYLVQIQAISQYGDAKLKSERVSMYITTYPLPQAIRGTPDEVDVQELATPRPVTSLVIHSPFYQNGLLKVNISWDSPPKDMMNLPTIDDGSQIAPPPPMIDRVMITWKPDVCFTDVIEEGMSQTLTATTEETWFLIFDLRFDCHYEVTVHSLSKSGVTGPPNTLSFPTPSCQGVLVKGSMRPDCPTNAAPRIPEAPIRLQSSFIISRGNISALLGWVTPPSDTPITGFRVQWGRMLLDLGAESGPVMDRPTVFYKVLGKDETSYSINNLREATRYVAKVQALSRGTEGRTSTVVFNTPLVSLKPYRPPYSAVTESNRRHLAESTDRYLQPTASLHEYPYTAPSCATCLSTNMYACVITLTLAFYYSFVPCHLRTINRVAHYKPR